jgi:biopolymer transport protein TolQ
MEAEAVTTAQQIDFSLLALFLRATPVVKVVMIVLALASFWSWAIIVEKLLRFRTLRGAGEQFEAAFWSGQPLEELHDRLGDSGDSPLERIFLAGMAEWRKSHQLKGGLIPGAISRIERAMNVAIAKEAHGAETRLGFLATVGSISPFVGLFGTVWGIKNSFEAIAIQQNTNLAVVAPGIAEALVATALGLLAAIPAVIFYNKLSSDANVIVGRMENFVDEFSLIISRQLERKGE